MTPNELKAHFLWAVTALLIALVFASTVCYCHHVGMVAEQARAAKWDSIAGKMLGPDK